MHKHKTIYSDNLTVSLGILCTDNMNFCHFAMFI